MWNLAVLGGLACNSSDSPTSGSITAPSIESPVSGSTVAENQPTLTVGNASGGVGEPTYRFEVATDGAFSDVIASEEGIGQGAGGTTSWRATEPLSGGEVDGEGFGTYYWRARASATGEVGPWSPTANFKLKEGFLRPSGDLLVFDPLTNGASVGRVQGGTFNSRGWMATSASTYIRYEVPTLVSGFVDFDVTNLREPNPVSDKRMLMIMWDPTRGNYTINPFRVHLQKLDHRTVDNWNLRLRFISQRHETNFGYDFLNWDRNQVYNFRMEWGTFPGIDSQWVRVLFDGEEILTRSYEPLYNPTVHWIELGGAPRRETLEQAIFSNVRIGRR